MNKLQMAHEWAMKHGSAETIGSRQNMIKYAWEYADAMQAEANKRTPPTKSLLDIAKVIQGLDFGEDHECNFVYGRACLCGKVKDEWQPDWSQAPDGFDWFVVWADEEGINKGGFFYNSEPKASPMDRNLASCWIVVNGRHEVTELFGYIGSWQDSLRKRPK